MGFANSVRARRGRGNAGGRAELYLRDAWPYVHRVKNSGGDEYHVILVELLDRPGAL